MPHLDTRVMHLPHGMLVISAYWWRRGHVCMMVPPCAIAPHGNSIGRAIMTWGQLVCPEGQRGAAGGTDLRPSQGTLEEEERPSRPAGVIAPYGPASRRRRTPHPLQFYQGH